MAEVREKAELKKAVYIKHLEKERDDKFNKNRISN